MSRQAIYSHKYKESSTPGDWFSAGDAKKWDLRFIELAQHISMWSKDPSTKLGAVITNGKKVVSIGFNGFPQGMSDAPELYKNRDEKYSRVVHGEINALIFAEKSVAHHTLYTFPLAPCDRCCVQYFKLESIGSYLQNLIQKNYLVGVKHLKELKSIYKKLGLLG